MQNFPRLRITALGGKAAVPILQSSKWRLRGDLTSLKLLRSRAGLHSGLPEVLHPRQASTQGTCPALPCSSLPSFLFLTCSLGRLSKEP